LLVVIYARRYPDQPFCPWLLGTEFVEHFFGLARMMLPNFTWAEFIKLVQHVMVRQRILLSGKFKEKRERNARLGYVLDFDSTPLTADDRKLAMVTLTDNDMDSLVEMACVEASLICTQLLHIRIHKPTPQKPLDLAPLGVSMPKAKSAVAKEELDSSDDEDYDDEGDNDEESSASEPFSHLTSAESTMKTPSRSLIPHPNPSLLHLLQIIDASGKLSLSMMLQARTHWQASTTTRSEKVSQIDSKFALSRIARARDSEKDDDTEPEKMTLQEASNLTRVLQYQNATIPDGKPVKYREVRWKGIAAVVSRLVDTKVLPHLVAKNVHQLNPLNVATKVVMWNGTRFYIGEIMDVFRKGANSRHASVPGSPSISGLSYLSQGEVSSQSYYNPKNDDELQTAQDQILDDYDSDQETSSADLIAPLFSCYHRHFRVPLSSHAKIDHLVFNFGPGIFERAEPSVRHRTLKPHAAKCWLSLTTGMVSKENWPQKASYITNIPSGPR
ncbi:hypothetical protein B0H14DRAFT_3782694, partial [Mycena olivaceomarginata]